MQAARDNIKDPPGIFVKVGLESLRGTLRFIQDDLPRAFGDLGDLHLLGDLADAATEASTSIAAYVEFLETDLAPRTKGSFRLGRERFEQKFNLDEGFTLGADRLLAIATRELQKTQDEFRRVASRVNGGDPLAAWQKTKADHPPAGKLVAVAEEQLAELADFIRREGIISLPEGAPVTVRPTPRFYRWTSASMWTPGPFESRPVRAFYYITDVDPAWATGTPGRAPARLQLRRALVDLDSRGVSGPLPPLPAPAPGRARRSASRSSSRRRPSSKGGRTTASR